MKYWNWVVVVFFVLGLIGVRFWERELFYDPFLDYFGYEKKVFPEFEWGRLIISHLFRFFLNLFFSLGVVHFIFLNSKWTIQALVLIGLSFLIFFPLYLYFIYTEFSIGNLFSFYVRRFVIQPLPVLLIVPLFYHRKYLNK